MSINGTAELVGVNSGAQLHFIVSGFLLRYPPRTRDVYKGHLRQWIDYCQLHGLEPLTVKRAHIEAWARHLGEERGLKPATVAAKLNAVCGLYKYAQLDGHIQVDPSVHVRRPKIQFMSKTNGLSRPQVADLLRAAEKEGPYTYALLCLLALSGLRISETLAADVEHLAYERGHRTIHLPNRKGGKISTLGLSVQASWALDQALDGRTTGPLLLGRDGERLKVAAARRTIRRLCAKCGITKRITPHSFRVSYITMSLDAGVAARDIAASTSHASLVMISYYDANRASIERNPTHIVSAYIGVAS